MITSRITRNRGGDLQFTIRVVGHSDIYRLAHHLLTGQVEFSKTGRRTLNGLRRRYSPERWKAFDDFMGGPAFRRSHGGSAS